VVEIGERADLTLFNAKDSKVEIVKTIVGGIEKN
jgi:hypothetical protein